MNLIWEKISRDRAIEEIVSKIKHEALTKKVLFLLSGGSNVHVAVDILAQLDEQSTKNLTIGLIDERFGDVGHADSNWQALQNAGFNGKQATLLPVLQQGLSRQDTAAQYEEAIRSALQNTDISIGLLGIGEDGHTAGILPRSIAAQDTDKLVVDYASDPFERITLSFTGLKKLDVAYVFAYGAAKIPQLQILHDNDLDVQTHPAQIIKQIREAYVYNEDKGEIT